MLLDSFMKENLIKQKYYFRNKIEELKKFLIYRNLWIGMGGYILHFYRNAVLFGHVFRNTILYLIVIMLVIIYT